MRPTTKSKIVQIIKKEYTEKIEDPILPLFLKFFQEKFSDCLISVILYGSMIDPLTRKPGSFHDFYIVVDSYRRAYSDIANLLLNKILPPSVYLGKVESNGEENICKYNVISFSDLCESIKNPKDIYIVGRFAKRLHILYARSDIFTDKILELCADAFDFNLRYTIPLLERFDFTTLIRETLTLSYLGEVRIESKTKIEELLEAHRLFYENVYGLLFSDYKYENEGVLTEEIVDENGSEKTYWTRVSETIPSKEEVVKFLRKSARLGVARWPKGLITFRGYKEYLFGKAERSKQELNLTELDRRLPLLFGWRHVFRLWREGKLRAGIDKK